MAVRIYIVEDNELMREMLMEFLNEVGEFSVCGVAVTGEEALKSVDGSRADLILIDMALPEMSGAELVSRLSERSPDLPCLIYSGHREISYVEQALAHGARGYMLKGNPDELPAAIRTVMNGGIYLSASLRHLI